MYEKICTHSAIVKHYVAP